MGRECCGLVVQPVCYKSPSRNPSQTCQIVSLTLREARNHNPAHRAGGGVRRWAVGRLEYVGCYQNLCYIVSTPAYYHLVTLSTTTSKLAASVLALWLTLFRRGEAGGGLSSSQYNYKAGRVKSSFQNKQSRSGCCGLTDPCIVCQNHHSPITFVWNTFSLD